MVDAFITGRVFFKLLFYYIDGIPLQYYRRTVLFVPSDLKKRNSFLVKAHLIQ